MMFVDGLREPGAKYLQMLANYSTLRGGTKSVLREMLTEGTKRCLLVQSTRQELVENELSVLGQLAASQSGAEPPPPATKMSDTERRVRDALATYDPSLLAPKQPTPLGKFAAERILEAKNWVGHGGMLLDILALGTPAIVDRTRAFHSEVDVGAAWLWKSLMGTCQFSQQQAVSFWPWKNQSHPDVKDIERTEDGIFHKLGAKATPLFQFANVAARSLHLYYALRDFEEASGQGSEIKALEAAESFLQFSQTLIGLAEGHNRKVAILKGIDPDLDGTKIAGKIGPIADTVAFAIAFQKWKAVKHRGVPARLREKERMDLLLEFVSLALSLLAAAVGAELVILGAIVAFAKILLKDLDAWVPKVVPGLGSKPAPHRYLEALLTALLKEDEGYAQARAKVKGAEMKDLDLALRSAWTDLATPPLSSAQLMWGISGPAGSELKDDATKIVKEHWKGQLSDDAIAKILS